MRQQEERDNESIVARDLFSSFLHDSLLDISADLQRTPVGYRHVGDASMGFSTPRGGGAGKEGRTKEFSSANNTRGAQLVGEERRKEAREEARVQPSDHERFNGSGGIEERRSSARGELEEQSVGRGGGGGGWIESC